RQGKIAVGVNTSRGIHRQYTYDAAGNPRELLDARWGATTYTYDVAGRITSAQHQSSGAERFFYDPADNFTKINRVAGLATGPDLIADGGTQNWQYGKGNELIKRDGVTYTYDALGQLARKSDGSGQTTYEWNRARQLAKVILPNGDEWRYKYDALGRRAEKRGPFRQTEFLWVSDASRNKSPLRDERETKTLSA